MRSLRFLVVIGCALSLFGGGCGPRRVVVNGVELTVEEAARAELDAARAKARAGEHAAAADLFEAVARRYPDAAEADEALFEAGQSHEAASQPKRAADAYRALVEAYPSSDKAGVANARALALGGEKDAALEAAKDAYASLPDSEKHAAARDLAQKAQRAGQGREAFRWRLEQLDRAGTAAERQQAETELRALVDAGLTFLQISELAEELEDASPAAPLVRAKLAKIYLHLRDYGRLEPALSSFLSKYPTHPFSAEARTLLEKVKKRGVTDPVKVGVVLPLSGKFKAFGDQVLAGIRLATEGSPVVLVTRDSKGEPIDAATAVDQLVHDEHVVAILGGVLTAEAQAAALKAAELGVPIVSFSRAEGFTKLGDWVFRDMLTSSQMSEALLRFAVDVRGMKRFAVLHPELPYGEELRDEFWKGVDARGGEIRGVESYAQDATSFSEPIKKLVGRYYVEERAEYLNEVAKLRAQNIEDARKKRNALEKLRSSLSPVIDFDALFLPDKWQNIALVSAGLAFEDVITNWCDLRDIERIEKTAGKKVKPVMLLGANLWNHPDLPTRAGKYVNCSVFVDGFYAQSSRPETAKFVQAFLAQNGKLPGLLEAYGFDAALAVRAVVETRRPQTRGVFREALLGVRDLPGSMGMTSVSPERELLRPLFYLTVDRGTIREADPNKKDGPP